MPDDTTPTSSDGEGAPASEPTTGGTRGKLRDLANASIQSVADRSIALAEQGRFDEIDPKMREVLLAGVNLATTGEDLSSTGESNPTDPALARYAEIGKKALANQALAKIEGETRDKVARESRLSDAQDLFNEFADVEIDVKDWQAVDPTNFRLFPMNEEGNRKWRASVSRFRGAQYASMTATPASEKENTSLAADRQNASARPRQPQPRSTGAPGVASDLEAAKGFISGKQSREQYVERLRAKGIG